MMDWRVNLIVAPILLPLAGAAFILLFGESRRALRRATGIVTVTGLAALSLLLLEMAAGQEGPLTYRIGDWPVPFAITLVLDRLSAMMLVLTGILGGASILYASSRWDRAGPRFHALVLLQLMGLNGAFLTGDLFNLFVFFEVLLAASYGLLLHGTGRERVSAALHYIVINVVASLLFLIGASLIYGVTGTLNIADLAVRMSDVRQDDVVLLKSGLAVLGIAFFIKAAIWPLGFWLPTTYSAATPPAAALFAILSKVGIYAVLRVILLPAGVDAAALPHVWLESAGMVTIAFGTIGLLASRTLPRLAGHSLIISTGILLATIGVGGEVLAGALYYLVSSTLALSAFYLLIELVGRSEMEPAAGEVPDPVFDDEYQGLLEQKSEAPVGVVIPATLAILGGGFLFCAVLIAGLPPLSGFVGKVLIIDALLDQRHAGSGTWSLILLIILSGLATVIATSRAGVDFIWTPEAPRHHLRLFEAIAIGTLLLLCFGLTIFAGPMTDYLRHTVASSGVLAASSHQVPSALGIFP